jgi:hypothetical protein
MKDVAAVRDKITAVQFIFHQVKRIYIYLRFMQLSSRTSGVGAGGKSRGRGGKSKDSSNRLHFDYFFMKFDGKTNYDIEDSLLKRRRTLWCSKEFNCVLVEEAACMMHAVIETSRCVKTHRQPGHK